MTLRFHADCAFHIGSQHLRTGCACQDYAVAGTIDDRAYAVVSDGCSSGGRTDVGARLIALTAARCLREVDDVNPFHFILSARPFDLGINDLLATCLTLSVSEAGTTINIQGDGVVSIKEYESSLYMIRTDWARNMPCYPAYANDDFAGFIASQGGPDFPAFRIERDINGDCEVQTRPVSAVLDGYRITLRGPLSSVAVFSDGVTQVDGMDWKQVVRELMSFKSVEGDFVKRRLNRFIRDAKGRGPIDDIAMAAIVAEEAP